MSTDYLMVCKKCRKYTSVICLNVGGVTAPDKLEVYDFVKEHLEHGITIENEHSEIVEDINCEDMNASSGRIQLKLMETIPVIDQVNAEIAEFSAMLSSCNTGDKTEGTLGMLSREPLPEDENVINNREGEDLW